MKRNIIITGIMLVVLAFGQMNIGNNIKLNESRLSPRLLNYQGYLTDTLGNPLTNSGVSMTFGVWSLSAGGTQSWFETQVVAVSKGIFSVLLGSVTPVPDSVFSKSADRWLELTVAGITLSPRTRIVSVPYAYTSTLADTAENAKLLQGKDTTALDVRFVNEGQANSIITAMIIDTAVTLTKIAPTGALAGQVIKYSGGKWLPGNDLTNADNHWAYLVSDGADTTLQTGGRWGLARLGNTLFGTADSTHVNFGVACTTGTSGANNKYCTVAGGLRNIAGHTYSTVGGGYSNNADTNFAVVAGGYNNTASGYVSAVGGGWSNLADSSYATAAGGYNNAASSNYATVGGGRDNTASGYYAAIAGGRLNHADAYGSSVAGGVSNNAGGYGSAVAGGVSNAAGDYYSVVAGGSSDTANAPYSAALAGYSNLAGNAAEDTAAAVGAGYNNSALAKHAFVGGGTNNLADNNGGFIGGGSANTASGICAVVSGGYSNVASSNTGVVAGGTNDTTRAIYGSVLGGYSNLAGNAAADTAAVVAGGSDNSAIDRYSTVGGGRDNVASDYCANVAGGTNNTASGEASFVGGGLYNTASNLYSTVAGGRADTASGNYAVVAGGWKNTASYYYSTVTGGYGNNAAGWGSIAGGINDTSRAVYGTVLGGYGNLAGDAAADSGAAVCAGYNNSALSRYAFVGGGKDNVADTVYALVAGGTQNTASGVCATVAGGWMNTAGGYGATIAGGGTNHATGYCAAIPGGDRDTVEGDWGFAAGYRSIVPAAYSNSAAFNGQTVTSNNQTRVGILSKVSGTFTIDHPLDPENKILNHYFVESPEMSNLYSGSVVLDAAGRAAVDLPDYFDALNKNPRVQLTGVGSSDVYVAEDFQGNRFAIGGKPGMKVYYTVVADRKDPGAEITRLIMPVEQVKEGGLAGRSLDDEFLVTTKEQLEKMGKVDGFKFRHASEQRRYEEMKRMIQENK